MAEKLTPIERYTGSDPYVYNAYVYGCDAKGRITQRVTKRGIKDKDFKKHGAIVCGPYGKFIIIEKIKGKHYIRDLCQTSDVEFIATKIYPYLKGDIGIHHLLMEIIRNPK